MKFCGYTKQDVKVLKLLLQWRNEDGEKPAWLDLKIYDIIEKGLMFIDYEKMSALELKE